MGIKAPVVIARHMKILEPEKYLETNISRMERYAEGSVMHEASKRMLQIFKDAVEGRK